MKWANQRVRYRLCRECSERRARYRYRGAVKADRDHTLCFRCHRSLSDSIHRGANGFGLRDGRDQRKKSPVRNDRVERMIAA